MRKDLKSDLTWLCVWGMSHEGMHAVEVFFDFFTRRGRSRSQMYWGKSDDSLSLPYVFPIAPRAWIASWMLIPEPTSYNRCSWACTRLSGTFYPRDTTRPESCGVIGERWREGLEMCGWMQRAGAVAVELGARLVDRTKKWGAGGPPRGRVVFHGIYEPFERLDESIHLH